MKPVVTVWTVVQIAFGILVVLVLVEFVAGLSVSWTDRLPAFFAAGKSGERYVLAPGRYRYWHRDRTVTVTIGDDHWRAVPGAPAEVTGELWLIGDSQVFGWGLRDGETIAAQLQRHLGEQVRVVNAGLPGAGPMWYAQVLQKAPPTAIKLILFTELNDGQDAYIRTLYGKAHCGYLVAEDGVSAGLPCWILESQTFSTLIDVVNVLLPQRLSPSLNCNPTVRSAAAVIDTRIQTIVKGFTAHRPVLTASIPWDARLYSERLADYVPQLDHVACDWAFPDEAGLADYLATQTSTGALFQPHDHHLSARGAEAVARHLAAVLVRSGLVAPAVDGAAEQAQAEKANPQ